MQKYELFNPNSDIRHEKNGVPFPLLKPAIIRGGCNIHYECCTEVHTAMLCTPSCRIDFTYKHKKPTLLWQKCLSGANIRVYLEQVNEKFVYLLFFLFLRPQK